ncbi:glycosyl hydrolase family 3 [Paenibacillus sp. FSL P4-0081]|uniref:beta-glucosidase BglX n=1 Tax=Paenibacillus sp. FSL P4-0081 TaxID=1536769 RepID=UPI0004F7D664|nr:beta-glucosidase BglX [Paenibacillus sp. FSL P4-0081]AIQ31971.1 glycosyl hydrolase family 3 [Paenibacillus sp. FSL P4-0081]
MTKPFIQDLVNDMTLDEKMAQLTQLGPYYWGLDDTVDLTGPFKELNIKPQVMENIGSVLNGIGARNVIELQTRHLESSRQKIPLLFMADVIHGYRTILPIPLAMGSSFDLEAIERFAEIAARESAAAGIHVTFSPMTDLVRDPRWGRVMETSGEDPYLNARVTESMVRGYQGTDLKEPGRIAACVKHFAGYGAPEGGREYNTVDMSTGVLREFYLPAYKAAVDAGVAMVMAAFNTIDRIPASGNSKLLRGILREEWGFDGVTIADFNSVNELVPHGAAQDGREAAHKSLAAGLDIEMMSTHYLNHGAALVEEGLLDISLIDEAVTRVLELKDALGLFDNPFKDADPVADEADKPSAEHLQAARELGASSVVLLKNENEVLPLKRGMKLGLAGPFATSIHVLGGWAGAEKDPAVSLYTGITGKIPAADIVTAMTGELGSMLEGVFDVEDHAEEAFEQLKDCDVILAAVGENQHDTGEGGSKASLRLSANQEKLIRRLKDTGKPVVTIVFSGRPLELAPVLDASDALVQAWFLGSESGNSIADVLFGDYNPSGRLSMSFPYSVGQIPVYYNAYQTGRPYDPQYPNVRYVTRYLDIPNDPLFCFGYGLSYSSFVYSSFNVEAAADGRVLASIEVENTSEVTGKETVQLYIRDVTASVVRPVKELKGFKQVTLAAHEKQVITFEITREMLMFYGQDDELVFEPGDFDIMIGRNSGDHATQRIWIG